MFRLTRQLVSLPALAIPLRAATRVDALAAIRHE